MLKVLVTTRYVTYTRTGGGKRHHGATNGVEDIYPPASSQMGPGANVTLTGADPVKLLPNGNKARFVFWSIVGGLGGSVLSVDANPSVQIGGQDVVAMAVYLEEGGGGGGGSGNGTGFVIDAFDANLGGFVDDDFVTVTPDSDGTLTHAGNWEGFVSTAVAETIEAVGSIQSALFIEWLIAGSAPQNNPNLQAAAQASGVAFAIYKAPPLTWGGGEGPEVVDVPDIYEATWTAVTPGEMVDGGGPHVGPWNPEVFNYSVLASKLLRFSAVALGAMLFLTSPGFSAGANLRRAGAAGNAAVVFTTLSVCLALAGRCAGTAIASISAKQVSKGGRGGALKILTFTSAALLGLGAIAAAVAFLQVMS